MKENEQASLSIKKIALITIMLIFMLGVGVRATTASLNTVKIVLSDNYQIEVITTKKIVSEILEENHIIVLPTENVFPSLEAEISGENATITITSSSDNPTELTTLAEESEKVSIEQILSNYSLITEKIITKNEDIPYETVDEDGKEILCFGDMLGHEYYIVPAESIKGEYIITGGTYQEAEKLFQKAIYNSLIEIGEDEQFAFAVAYEGEDPGMLLTFRRECFETELDMLTEQIDIGKQNLIRNGNKEEDLILILNTKIYEKDRYKKISNIDVQYAEMPENIKIQIEVRKQEEVD